MNADFIKGFLKRIISLPEHLEERPELVLRNPGPLVYLYKAGNFYKLGRTRDGYKRDKQIKLQLPFRAIQIHIIHTDDEVWLEKCWHREFDAKRCNGEWFELDEDDVARFCSHYEILKSADIAQLQFVFEEDEPQPIVALVRDSDLTPEQPSYEVVFVQEVESYYQNLIALHPKLTRSLEGSRKYQIGSMDAEISRLQQKRGYSEIQALQEWKRKALMAADANTRPSS